MVKRSGRQIPDRLRQVLVLICVNLDILRRNPMPLPVELLVEILNGEFNVTSNLLTDQQTAL